MTAIAGCADMNLEQAVSILRANLKIGGHDAWEGHYYYVDGIEAAANALIAAIQSHDVAQPKPNPLAALIKAKMSEPAFQKLAEAWPLRELRYLPVIKMSPCAVSDWYVLLPSGKQIILGGADWDASIVPSTEGK